MKRPSLYIQSFKPFMFTFGETFKEFGHALKWKGSDNLLDIGCGPGHITRDFIVPIMPNNFSRIVGVDNSKEMIEYARKHYSHARVEYKIVNIEATNIDKYDLGQFNHIISLHCLHWVHDFDISLKNIYNLLESGGDCVLTFFYKINHFTVINEMSKMEKWSKYFTSDDRILPILHNSDDPIEETKSAMNRAGFKNINVHLRNRNALTTTHTYKDFLHSLDIYYDRIPEHERQNYLNDQLEVSKRVWEIFGKHENDIFPTYFSQVVCHAIKN